MLLKKTLLLIGITVIALSVTACKKSVPVPAAMKNLAYKPLDLSGKSAEFVRGVNDGCDTAVNKYTKDHDGFNTNVEYHNGWFAGRKNCENKPRELAD